MINRNLCTGCGICAGACPVNAITMQFQRGIYLPFVYKDRCISCGLCKKICPGEDANRCVLEQTFLAGASLRSRELGTFRQCFEGYALDQSLRLLSASGGTISALLKFMFDGKLIDGALIVIPATTNPILPKAIIARNFEEAFSGRTSRYAPVEFSAAVRTIGKVDGRYVAVGLPCHLAGLRKLQMVDSRYRNRIRFMLGLMCGHGVSINFTLCLLQKHGICAQRVKDINYRAKDKNRHSYYLSIVTNSAGEERANYVPSESFRELWGSYLLARYRCLLCDDFASELADITFGDAWLPEFKKESEGRSLLISRTEAGDWLLKRSAAYLYLQGVAPESVIEAQRVGIDFKKVAIRYRLQAMKMCGRSIPRYREKAFVSNEWQPSGFLNATLLFFTIWVAEWLYRNGNIYNVDLKYMLALTHPLSSLKSLFRKVLHK